MISVGSSTVRSPLRGVLLLVCALFLFALMDSAVKYLSTHYNVPLIMAIRYIVHCLLMIVILTPSYGKQLVQTRRTGLVLIRAGCLAAVSLFVGLALQRMPVAETTAISFLAPMLVVFIAGPLLGERLGVLGWTAALTGFAGVLLIVRPSSGLDGVGIAYALCAVGGNAAYQLLSRVLMSTERAVTLLFYTALIGATCFGAVLPWFWEGKPPTLWQLLLFLSLGVTGGLGHFLFTSAYRYASASVLAPITYLQLLWAGLLGWMYSGMFPIA